MTIPEHSASPSLQEALAQIGEIRAQMNEATLFRGYRALPVAATGVMAIATAVVQAALVPRPEQNVAGYVLLWVGLASLCLALVMVQLVERYRTTDSELVRRSILHAMEKFAPCVAAGALTTAALMRFAADSAPVLPGLWATYFSLGIFASWRNLPRLSLLIGGFYLGAGTLMISAADNASSLSPYGMGITFGLGQLATAAVLYFSLERKHASTE